jgi:hypothetical protein
MAALERALGHLSEADAAADAAHERLGKQNERLAHLGENMDKINENLDETEEQISGLESTFGVVFGGWLDEQLGEISPMLQQCLGGRPDMGLHLHKLEPEGEVVKQGWLMKRGRAHGYGWKKRWVVAYPLAIFIYEDKERTKKKTAFALTAGTEVLSFKNYDAPGDAIEYRWERENGFVMKIPPGKAGRRSVYHYFDARTFESTSEWLQKLETTVRRISPETEGDATEENAGASNEQGLGMDLINDKLDALEKKAKVLGKDVKDQNMLVNSVAGQVDGATDRILDQDQKLRNHINKG